jgi:acyl-CoA dehydrogenase
MLTLGWVLFFLVVMGVLAFQRASLVVQAIGFAVALLFFTSLAPLSAAGVVLSWMVYALVFSPLLIRPVRRALLSRPILGIYRASMPSMSRTEREALAAGTVGFEKELFSGFPDWSKLHDLKRVHLSAEEQAFLAGPVETLCGMIDVFKINHELHQIPSDIWDFLKKEGFFSLIIPKSYGGKEFSALAHSQIIVKVAGVSSAVATAMSVPNSLGPAELLLAYGTEQQKNYYLPRLAKGDEIPCFALTSPVAGSDAGSIEDYGIVTKRIINGQEQLGILLNWSKRYITLAPVATLLGLAFKLYDPEHLLSDKEDLGITCALIPVTTPGVVIGRRHFPLCSHFPNGPTQGKDVFVSLDAIIGGRDMAGAGWRMLMECLAVGRAISLPSTAAGGVKRMLWATGPYARIRRQFNTAIGSFGGIQEALARIGGYTLITEALRLLGVCAIDNGQQSSVVSAISKYHTTEYARKIINDAMDVHGGKAICMGSSNYVAQPYIECPIGITVEGANILTRNMIIFGQGAIRCHPYILSGMRAAENKDKTQGLKEFDQVFFKHIGMFVSNHFRSLILSISPLTVKRGGSQYYRQLNRLSAQFGLLADMAMFTLGASLKRRERLSARLGDVLSYLYSASAVLKYAQYHAEQHPELQIAVDWAITDLIYRAELAMKDFLANCPNRVVAAWLRVFIFPLGMRAKPPKDRLGHKLADLQMEDSAFRRLLTQHLYLGQGLYQNPMCDVQEALKAVTNCELAYKKLQEAKRAKKIHAYTYRDLIQQGFNEGVINQDEREILLSSDDLAMRVIHVDDFPAYKTKEPNHDMKEMI